MNTHAFIAIAAAFAVSGCQRHADQQQQAPTSVPTSSVGRYQAVAVPRSPGSGFDSVLILDTRDGDLWQWIGSPGSGPLMLRYMGHLRPGSHMGDIVQQNRD
jgi:hypothetical protein